MFPHVCAQHVLLCTYVHCICTGNKQSCWASRYLGLSHTWRKFFCVLSPREKSPGYAVDMQLLVFSKNGFDPVTSVLMTDAALIEVPLKAAHGRACYELVRGCWLSSAYNVLRSSQAGTTPDCTATVGCTAIAGGLSRLARVSMCWISATLAAWEGVWQWCQQLVA